MDNYDAFKKEVYDLTKIDLSSYKEKYLNFIEIQSSGI